MATSTAIRTFDIGNLVHFNDRLCRVEEKHNEFGYFKYKVACLDTGNIMECYAWQMSGGRNIEDALTEANFEIELDDGEPEQESKRFSKVTEEDKAKFRKQQMNTNTVKKTRHDVNVLKEYMKFIEESRLIKDIPAKELNSLLEDFFMCVKKSDGTQFEPNSLRGILGSIHRHLQEEGYVNIMTAEQFQGMRNIISAKNKVTCHVLFSLP